MRKVTMQDVANKAEVSKSTVSQFINNRYEYMAAATKERIENAVKDLGYIPNHIAKSLKQKKTSTIGVIVANIIHSFSNEMIRAIEDVCEQSGVHMFVCNADDNPKKEKSYMEMLLAKQVDGLIIFPTGGNMDFYHSLKKNKFPIVFVDRKIEPSIYPTFMLDNIKAASLAVNELIQSNKKKIGLVSTSINKSITPRIERIEGYKKALVDNDIEINDDYIVTTERMDIIGELEEMWRRDTFPDAFFAVNDLSLIELLKFLTSKNINIPQQVSVISVDDSPFLEISTPPTSVVKQPTFDIGRDAAKKILELITNATLEDIYEVNRYTPILIKRASI